MQALGVTLRNPQPTTFSSCPSRVSIDTPCRYAPGYGSCLAADAGLDVLGKLHEQQRRQQRQQQHHLVYKQQEAQQQQRLAGQVATVAAHLRRCYTLMSGPAHAARRASAMQTAFEMLDDSYGGLPTCSPELLELDARMRAEEQDATTMKSTLRAAQVRACVPRCMCNGAGRRAPGIPDSTKHLAR
jgi:hypothetical protein